MGIGALIVAFAGYSLIIDEPAAVIVVIVLSIFLMYRAVIFQRYSGEVAASLSVIRTVDKRTLRQGAAARVLSTASLSLPPGMQAEVCDLLPPVAEGRAPVYMPSENGLSASYELRLMAPGEARFAGVRLRLSDTFFSDTILCQGEAFRLPAMRAIPYGIAQDADGYGTYGTEIRKRGFLRGQETYSFRPYRRGDDLSMVDWKLSAKRDSFMVREPGRISGGSPLIIIDLPETGTDENSALAFFTLVGGVVEGALDASGTCRVLIISGANLITYLSPESGRDKFLLEMSRLAPVVRQSHLFRMPGRAVMDARRRALKGVAPLNRILQGTATTAFEVSVLDAMAVSGTGEAHLYSIYRGDLSHIGQTVLAAKRAGMRILLCVSRHEAGVAEKLREYRSDGIEVI